MDSAFPQTSLIANFYTYILIAHSSMMFFCRRNTPSPSHHVWRTQVSVLEPQMEPVSRTNMIDEGRAGCLSTPHNFLWSITALLNEDKSRVRFHFTASIARDNLQPHIWACSSDIIALQADMLSLWLWHKLLILFNCQRTKTSTENTAKQENELKGYNVIIHFKFLYTSLIFCLSACWYRYCSSGFYSAFI